MLKSAGGFENARSPRPISRQSNPSVMNIANELMPAGSRFAGSAAINGSANRQRIATNKTLDSILKSFIISPVNGPVYSVRFYFCGDWSILLTIL
jgi:hypothetical protein